MSLIQTAPIKCIKDAFDDAIHLSKRDHTLIYDNEYREEKYPIYFIELIDNKYILRGQNINFIISDIDDCGLVSLVMHYKARFSIIEDDFTYIEDKTKAYLFQVFEYSSKELAFELSFSSDIEKYTHFDTVIKFRSNMCTPRCTCGYPMGANFQDIITYLCHNLDNINYKTHKIPIQFNTPKWYIKFAETDCERFAHINHNRKIYRYL